MDTELTTFKSSAKPRCCCRGSNFAEGLRVFYLETMSIEEESESKPNELKCPFDKAITENLKMREAIRAYQNAEGRHAKLTAAKALLELNLDALDE